MSVNQSERTNLSTRHLIVHFNVLEITAHTARHLLWVVESVMSSLMHHDKAMKHAATDYPLRDPVARLGPSVDDSLEKRLLNEPEQTAETIRLQTTAMEAAANGIVITDKKGTILWVNPAFCSISGYSAQEVLGQTPRLLKSGKHDQEFYRHLWKTILSGETWRGEFTNCRKDGRLYYGEQTITPVCSKTGGITHFVGVVNDVTKRKEAEEELRKTHEELRQLLAHSPAVIYTLKIDGEKLTPAVVSENIERFLGYTVAESTSYEWWLKSLHPDDRDRVLTTVAKGMKGQGYSMEYRIQHRDGTYRWVEDNNHVVRDVSGQPKEAVGVWTDITEHKHAEEALRRSEEEYRDLFENAHDLIQSVSPDGRLLYVNRAWREALGCGDEDLSELRLPDFVQPERRKDWETAFAEVLAGKQVKLAQLEFNSREGKSISVEGSITVKLVKGQADSLRCIFRDVTEKRKLEAQFLRTQRLENIGMLAGGIAHDLNNALAPVLMSIELLRMKFADAESSTLIETIAGSAQRGADMVKQVLTFSRGIEGKHVEVQVRHLIKEIRTMVQQTFPKSIQFGSTMAPDLWTVTGDATQLHQVLLNLCVNARDAMPHGGKLSIKAENVMLDEHFARMNTEAKAGAYVILTVTDTGTGIPPELRMRIFDPFFTTKPLGQGTGLGLSTVHGIVKSHGGFISVYSEVGKGTEFRVSLPAMTSSLKDRVETEVAAQPVGKGELILVVDDEAAIRKITQQTLEMFGYRVLTASDGAQAVATYAQQQDQIDLVLTDTMMPIMDGVATIRAIRSLDPATKVIIASGLPSEPSSTEVEGCRGDAILHKPYTADRLLKVIRDVLDFVPAS